MKAFQSLLNLAKACQSLLKQTKPHQHAMRLAESFIRDYKLYSMLIMSFSNIP
jgi:hypothetical protein